MKAFFFVIGEARIASPERVASPCEATVLALPLEVSLALLRNVFPSREVKIASLLAPNGALFLTLWQIFLALGVVSRSDAESAILLARKGALVLASRAAGLVLPSSIVDASEAAVASLLAQSTLALAYVIGRAELCKELN